MSGMLGSVANWARQLRESSQAHPHPERADCHQALERIDLAVAAMAGGETVELKKEIRDRLWDFRKSYGDEAAPEVRRGYEKLRNLTLDNTVERMAKGAKIPMSRFTTFPKSEDIPNFQVINDSFLRGGQPDQDGLDWLGRNGVTAIIDLRGDDRDNQWCPPVWNPIKTFTVDVPDFESPSIAMVEKFLSIADNPENGTVFLHCKAGIGRTGVMTACWNIAHGMSADDALKRESINSYHGSLRQEDFVREFESYWLAKQQQSRSTYSAA